jgi:hypothetical protein
VRKPRDQGERVARAQRVDRRSGGVVLCPQFASLFQHAVGRRQAALMPHMVQSAVARDRRHPAAEPGNVTAELPQVPGDLQPRLRGNIFRGGANLHPQVADQARLDGPVEHAERVFVAVLRGAHRRGQGSVVAGRICCATHPDIMWQAAAARWRFAHARDQE